MFDNIAVPCLGSAVYDTSPLLFNHIRRGVAYGVEIALGFNSIDLIPQLFAHFFDRAETKSSGNINQNIYTSIFFNSSINITADGTYVLHYSNFVYPIIVEDVPVFITGVVFEGFGPFEKILINLSTGETEELDISTLYYKKDSSLYCRVLNKKFPAKFQRSPSFHVLERLDEIEGNYFLNICGSRILLQIKE